MEVIKLVNENFKDFDIGDFPYDSEHSAIGEYHYYPNNGYHGIWYDPVCNYNYRGPSWIITEDNGEHYMEQMRIETTQPHIMHPMLVTGELYWRNYTVKAKIRILNTSGSSGIGFCAINSLNLLVLVFEDQHIKLIHRYKEEDTILSKKKFSYNCDNDYELKVICEEDNVSCYVDDGLVLTGKTPIVKRGGRISITSNVPVQYKGVEVSISKHNLLKINEIKQKQELKLKEKAEQYPAMKLWRKIDLKDFGTGRQIRFGHLTKSDDWHIVLAQCQKRVHKDAYATISCLTAIDLFGNILWQRGEPSDNPNFALLSADVPLQVYDIDNDGIDEVITAKNFEILILEGATGKIKKRVKTPYSDDEDSSLISVPFDRYAFDRINPDAIRICNFSGNEYPSDILIKDRYCRVYVYNSDLELIWKYNSDKNIGHFPYAFDFNGDGKDELFCGYDLLSNDGSLLWTLPIKEDHTDEIVIGKINPDNDENYIIITAGTEGVMIVDFKGNIIKKDGIGHAQRVSVGNYRPDHEGYEICASNYWGHQGIIYLYDYNLETIWEMENGTNGNILSPVNWKGDGIDLILIHADEERGGLMDGDGDIVVKFPKDGHPVLCVETIDLCGDARDELVVWDQKEMYIYTQEDNPLTSVYSPNKYPNYNSSNYRGEFSFPNEP